MDKRRSTARAVCASLTVVAIGVLGIVPSASAHKGEFARFNNCPSTNPSAWKCIQSITRGGKVVLGKKTVPIVNPVTLQGAFTEENEATAFSEFIGASNGAPTLTPVPQPVPGGLSGLVNCKEISNGILRGICEGIFENGLTGVNSTLELARPANQIKISQLNLVFEEGVALQLPVKVHLENPLLGSSCYIGSSTTPLIWKLTTGETTPPPPNLSIHGFSGTISPVEGGLIAKFTGNKLVDNAWSAPEASGCGGFPWEYILDPIINASVGVPAAAGKNTAILENEVFVAEAHTVNEH
jgi:hypothetical protein